MLTNFIHKKLNEHSSDLDYQLSMATGGNIMGTLLGILINYYWKKCLFYAEFMYVAAFRNQIKSVPLQAQGALRVPEVKVPRLHDNGPGRW